MEYKNCDHKPCVERLCSISNKNCWYGISILIVVLYHLYCVYPNDYLSIFQYGYIGVDIFFLFSGLGCAYSFSENNLVAFYKKRFLRVYPMFFIWAIIHFFVLSFTSQWQYTFFDFVSLSTTISYYGIGNVRANWYLSALMCLYLLYPILFLITKHFRSLFVVTIALVTLYLTTVFNFEWYHDAFVGRLFVFSYGILVFHSLKNDGFSTKVPLLVAVVFCVGGAILSCLWKYCFWTSSAITPFLCICLVILIEKIRHYDLTNILGKYSLEIFIANSWTMLCFTFVHIRFLYGIFLYAILNILFSIILIKINKIIQDESRSYLHLT